MVRSFEDWVKEVEDVLSKIKCPVVVQVTLDAIKTNRTLLHLTILMRYLHKLKLHNLCPTPDEIGCWIEQGTLRIV